MQEPFGIGIKSLSSEHRLSGIEAGAKLEATYLIGGASFGQGAGLGGRQNGDRLRDRWLVVPLATLPI